MLVINNLHATYEGAEILKGVSLTVKPGEIHSIMGPNGSGKSTLAKVLVGYPGYEVTEGTVLYRGENLLSLDIEERSLAGMFLAFQYPVEIAGVNNAEFMRMAYNTHQSNRNEQEMDPLEFDEFLTEKMSLLGMDEIFKQRNLNSGFSGGEKKKNEILQMAVLQPNFAVLDEIDSGLDIDALRVVSEGINKLKDPARSMILITHYKRLLDYVRPDVIHVMDNGKIVRTGDETLADELEDVGYSDMAVNQ